MAHLPIKFEVATNVSAYEEMQSRFGAPVDESAIKAEQLATLQNDMAIAARDGGIAFNNGGEMTGGARASADMAAAEQEADARNKENAETQILLASQRLASFEGGLEAKYGENFDLDLLSDLVEQGNFTQEDYAKFASIEDKDERKKAIAQAIQDKIDAGEIDPADLKDHPWAGVRACK